MRFHLTPVRMTIIKKSTNNKFWGGCGEKGTPLHCWRECKLIQPLWKTVWRFLIKLEIKLTYAPTIPLLGMQPEKTIIEKDTCSPMFIAALVTIARTWRQPRCPSTDEWINMNGTYIQWNIQFSSIAQSCLTLCDLMNRSTPGLPVHRQFMEFTQTHVHWVGDAIQPSHPLSSPSPPAFSLSQHQGLFQWVSSLH